MTHLFLDVETTGLKSTTHEVWEIAYAIDDGPILSSFVDHDLYAADPKALEIGHYHERFKGFNATEARQFEETLKSVAEGTTLVAANPAFDNGFLEARWGVRPWKYRLLDVEAYAMPWLGHETPQGLSTIATELGIEWPDHTAAQDVNVLRQVFRKLQTLYGLEH